MNTNNNDNDIKRRIDQYIEGQLSENEIDDLWAEIVQSQEHIDYLNTMANMRGAVEEKQKAKSIRTVWMYAAAAAIVVLIAIVGVMQFVNISDKPSELAAIESIELDYYRSTDTINGTSDRDKVIRTAIELYNKNRFEEAVSLLNQERANASDVNWIAELDITLGTFHYNEDKFEKAAYYFSDVLKYKGKIDVLVLEKAYWYLGNSYLQMNMLAKAESTMEKAYQLNGAYSRVAKSFLNAIADARSQQSL